MEWMSSDLSGFAQSVSGVVGLQTDLMIWVLGMSFIRWDMFSALLWCVGLLKERLWDIAALWQGLEA